MTVRATILSAACLLVVMATFYVYRHHEASRAPDVVFTTIEGRKIALRELRGHPVLVTFWASDCRSCIEEMPWLAEIYRQYAERGLRMIGVAMHYDAPARVLAITSAKGLPYPVALDLQARYAQAFAEVDLVPNSFLIAPNGEMAMHRLGLLDIPELKARIEAMLQEG
jgi:peroxiredoxin